MTQQRAEMQTFRQTDAFSSKENVKNRKTNCILVLQCNILSTLCQYTHVVEATTYYIVYAPASTSVSVSRVGHILRTTLTP